MFLSLALWTTAVIAVPAGKPNSDYVSQEAIDNMAYYAQYAAASYCDTRIPQGHVVTCIRERNSCPKVTSDNATILAYLDTGSPADTLGMASYNPKSNTIVVAFRGTTTVRDVVTDFHVEMTDCASAMSRPFMDALALTTNRSAECALHDGFATTWKSVRAKTLQTVREALAAHNDAANAAKIVGFDGEESILSILPITSQKRIRDFSDPPKIVVTGHSLGGATALLAAAELRAFGVPCELYTYGMPRIGSDVFVDFVTKQTPTGESGINNYRVTHSHDIVPQMPPETSWIQEHLLSGPNSTVEKRDSSSYFHTSPEFWLQGDGVQSDDGFITYTPSEVQLCRGYSNYDCNAQKFELTDWHAHGKYFSAPIGDCHKGPLDFYVQAGLSEDFPAAFGY